MTSTQPLYQEERHQYIVRELEKNAVVRVVELAADLSVSEATIRKDIRQLELLGKLRRTHGGAIKIPDDNTELRFEAAAASFHDEKVRIARAAAARINDGETLLVQSGTTAKELIKLLNGHRNMCVLTVDLHIALAAEAALKDSTVIMLGGIIRTGYHYCQGSPTIKQLQNYRVPTVYLSCNAFNLEGFSTHQVEQASFIQSELAIAEKTVMLLDSSKYNKNAVAYAGSWGNVQTLITDSGLPEDARQAFAARWPELELIVV